MELARDLEIGDKVYHIENKLKGIVTHRDGDDELLVEWEDGSTSWYRENQLTLVSEDNMEGILEHKFYTCSICGSRNDKESALECFKSCNKCKNCKHENYKVTTSWEKDTLICTCIDCNKSLKKLRLENIPNKFLKEVYDKCIELEIV